MAADVMMLRCNEPGWVRIGVSDPTGRRSMWVRFNVDDDALVSIELCAGREGDDAYVIVGSDDPIFPDLADVLRSAADSASPWKMLSDKPAEINGDG